MYFDISSTMANTVRLSQMQKEFGVRMFDKDALERAKSVVDQFRQVYVCEWAPDTLDEMEAAVFSLRHFSGEAANGETRKEALLRLSREMTGHANTFGFDLLSDFASSINAIVSGARDVGAREVDICHAHMMAMRTALEIVADNPDGVLSADDEKRLRRDLRKIVRMTFN
jgi:hypothetical protein